jgi:hypothetical protein
MNCGVEASVAEQAAVELPKESCAVLSDFAASKVPIADFKKRLRAQVEAK